MGQFFNIDYEIVGIFPGKVGGVTEIVTVTVSSYRADLFPGEAFQAVKFKRIVFLLNEFDLIGGIGITVMEIGFSLFSDPDIR